MRQRIRGAVGTAILWSITWALLCPPVMLWIYYDRLSFHDLAHRLRPLIELALTLMIPFAFIGAQAGILVALILCLAGRRAGSVDALSIRSTACWGALGGLLLPLSETLLSALAGQMPPAGFILPMVLMHIAGTAVGAIVAAGTLAMARRVPTALRAATSATAGTMFLDT